MTNQAILSNLMKYLFFKNTLSQSIRLELMKTWNHDHLELVNAIRMIHTLCSILMQSYLLVHEQVLSFDETFKTYEMTNDLEHKNAQLSLRSYELYKQLRINSQANLMRISSQHVFVQELMNAYEISIKIRVLNLRSKSLKWYRRVAYTNSWVFWTIESREWQLIWSLKRNCRYVHSIENFIRVAEKKTRLTQCFSHQYRENKYEFLIVNMIEKCLNDNLKSLVDFMLDLSVFKLISKQRIYNLWSLSRQNIYLIEASQKSNWQTKERKQYLIHCTWKMNYL